MDYQGLSKQDVITSREKFGSNIIPDSKPTTFSKKEQCKVYRDGVVTVINVDDVVVGDKVLLQAGDKIPADGVLIHGAIKVDNSALNEETEECSKTAAQEGFRLNEDITDDTFVDAHSLFRGAVLFDGEGVMDVQRVGLQTMMGKMAKEIRISKFGNICAAVIVILFFAYLVLSGSGPSVYFASGAAVLNWLQYGTMCVRKQRTR